MSASQPELVTVIRALQEVVWRLDVILKNAPPTADDDHILSKILHESGREAVTVAYNALDSLPDIGIKYSSDDGEAGAFQAAFSRLKAGPLQIQEKTA